jgi:hypothetical protein
MRKIVPPMDRLIAKSFMVPCRVKELDLPCWVTPNGWARQDYSNITIGSRNVSAHRLAYTEMISGIPEGLELDHLCRTPPCWNPWHLDPVTKTINLSRRNWIKVSPEEIARRTNATHYDLLWGRTRA